MTNVCYNFKDSQWIFFKYPGIGETKNEGLYIDYSFENETVLMKPLVNIGTYDSSELFKFSKIIVGNSSNQISNPNVFWISGNSVLYQAHSELYWHWLFDDLMGLWWLLTEHSIIPKQISVENKWNPDSLFITLEGKLSTHLHQLEFFFTNGSYQVKNIKEHKIFRNEVCFENLFIGPAKHQLGGTGNYQISEIDVVNYRNFLLSRAGLLGKVKPKEIQITIMYRDSSRKITNLNEVVEAIKKRYPSHRVLAVKMESLSIKEQLSLMQETTILIGVHGSGMSNIAFLQPHASVIEIFPYGFQRPTFQMLARKVDVFYKKWENTHREQTKFYPEVLSHLSNEERNRIVNAQKFTTDLPWAGNLYWINQDTNISIDVLCIEIDGALKSPLNNKLLEERKSRIEL